MRFVYRYLLKTRPNQPQMPEQAVSISTFEDHTENHSVVKSTSHTSSHKACSSICVEDLSVWRLAWSNTHTPKTSWTFGLPSATGTIQFEKIANQGTRSELSKEYAITEDTAASSPPTVRVKVVLPQWLSYKALDMIAWKAQIGWKQSLRVKNIFPARNSRRHQVTPFDSAWHTISSGRSLDQLRSQFQNRELTPWDENSDGKTLLMVGTTWMSYFLSFFATSQTTKDVIILVRCGSLSMGYLQLFDGPWPEHAARIGNI